MNKIPSGMELASHYNMLTLQYTVIILLEQLWSQSTYDKYGCMALKAPKPGVGDSKECQ